MVQPAGASEAPPEPEPQTNGTSASSSSALAPAPAPNAPQSKKTLEKVQQAKPAKSKGYAFLFKYVLVGDSGVGKSALLARFTKDMFQDQHIYTIGVDFDIKTMDLPNGDEVKLQIWDTAGQERFRNITGTYYRGAHGILVLYDVNDKRSYDSVLYWVREAQTSCQKGTPVVVIGTKTDLKVEGQEEVYDRQAVTQRLRDEGVLLEDGSQDANVLAVYEASAKTGEGVEEPFRDLTQQLVDWRIGRGKPRIGLDGTEETPFYGHDDFHFGNAKDGHLGTHNLFESYSKRSQCCCIL